MSRFLETIGTILPTELRPEYESLRTELRELARKLPELSETEVGRPKVIIHRMNQIIDSQPGLRKQARQIEDKLDLFREAMANDEARQANDRTRNAGTIEEKGGAMIAVHFSKAFAEKVNDAVNRGKPIPLPERGQWTQNDMLTLAGLLYAAVYSGGPHKQQIEGVTASDVKKMHSERKEAIEDTWFQDIHDGIEFVSMLAFKVFDGEYDDDCEPELKAIIATNAKGQKKVQLVEGFKKSEGGAGDSD